MMPEYQTIGARECLCIAGLLLASNHASLAQNSGPLDGISSASDYLVYYGGWNATKILQAQYFDLAILDIRSGISPSQIADMRNGLDDEVGTSDDVIVVSYLSIGEDDDGKHIGDGRGPVYWNSQSMSLIYQNRGVASWYVDDVDKDGEPDQNGVWGSYYVNAGDSLWQEFVRTKDHGADDILQQWKCDGLFLDTIDTASPWTAYSWTVAGMAECVARLRELFPQAIIIGNRGLFYFDPAQAASYAHNLRPYVNAIMFESYYTEWNWDTGSSAVSPYFADNKNYWAPRVNAEAQKSDGFTVLCLDYLNPAQNDYNALLASQMHEAIDTQGWTDAISSILLDEIRYDIYHRHTPDVNPPFWSNTVGVQQARVESGQVLVCWNAARDAHGSVTYTLYYGTASPLNLTTATILSNLVPQHAVTYDYKFAVPNLVDSAKYYFVLHAVDALGNEDANRVEKAVVFDGTTSVVTEIKPMSFRLLQNAPNPFNAGTIIVVELPPLITGEVALEIYDVLGRKVRELRLPAEPDGRIRFQWNGLAENGRRAGSGIYCYRASAGVWQATRKMILFQ